MKYAIQNCCFWNLIGNRDIKVFLHFTEFVFFNENLSFFNLVSDLLVSETSQKTRFD